MRTQRPGPNSLIPSCSRYAFITGVVIATMLSFDSNRVSATSGSYPPQQPASQKSAPTAQAPNPDGPPPAQVQRIVKEGIAIEMIVRPTAGTPNGALMQGTDARVTFRVSDVAAGAPLGGLHPAAWMDHGKANLAATPQECRQKIQGFIGGGLNARPELDLNLYYVLALNADASISVVDPLFGYGGSKLLALILLRNPGEDWVLNRDGSRLFVTMPASDQIAVIDTSTWKVIKNIDVGPGPVRIRIQPDQKYLWVGCDGPDGGVWVVDAESMNVAGSIKIGSGHHEIALSDDDRFAFVANESLDELSVIDVQKLVKVATVKTGRRPVSLAYSSTGKAVYVSCEADGQVLVVDGRRHTVLTRIKAEPGLGMIRFAPNGRLGFLVNTRTSVIHILDPAANRIVQTGDVGKSPDQVAFTDNLAYVRSRDDEIVLMIPLTEVGRPGPVPVVDFTGGQTPAGKAQQLSVADAIVPAPEGSAVLVANPMDQMIYYYKEGMAAPMGSFQNYGREPRAVLVVDRSLREGEPGTYSTNVKLPADGRFDVAFFLDSPRIFHCFELAVAENPAIGKKDRGVPIALEPLFKGRSFEFGKEIRLRFRVTDVKTGAPREGLKDVGVMAHFAAWQQRQWATPLEDGIYEVNLNPPRPGVYYVFFECPSLRVRFNELPYLVIHVV